MRSLNLDQLRTLMEVVELGNFSAAARRLNLTQPAVSLQIRDLEQRFGVQLIERMGKQAHATAPGRDLIEHARRIFQECEFAHSAMRRFREGWIGRVHIATSLTALMYELPPILKRLRAEHPGIDLLVTNMPTRDTIEHIIKNTVDIGLVTLPVDEPRLTVTPLREEPLVAILPATMRGVPDEITPDYAARQPLVLEHARGAIYGLVRQWLSKQLPLPIAPMHIGTIEAAKKCVVSNLGMSIVPRSVAADLPSDVLVRPLRPAIMRRGALIEHRNKPNDPALEIVRNALLELKAVEEVGPARRKRAASAAAPQTATKVAAPAGDAD